MKLVVPEHFGIEREGEKTGFLPLCMCVLFHSRAPQTCVPSGILHKWCLIRDELTGEGISQIHGHKHSTVKTEHKSLSVHIADPKLPFPKGPELAEKYNPKDWFSFPPPAGL